MSYGCDDGCNTFRSLQVFSPSQPHSKIEYDIRLNRLEDDARDLIDATALTKQKALLEKGKSRLIDSYASSIIDKGEFEPKIKTLKIKLAQIDEQIEQSIKTEDAQYELFLVINRLEEFAKNVDVTLDAVDFNTKREIIRALVKRVEIYKEEVVVVFRIDPEAPANDETSSTSPSETGGSIMHSCNRRTVTNVVEHCTQRTRLGVRSARPLLCSLCGRYRDLCAKS